MKFSGETLKQNEQIPVTNIMLISVTQKQNEQIPVTNIKLISVTQKQNLRFLIK